MSSVYSNTGVRVVVLCISYRTACARKQPRHEDLCELTVQTKVPFRRS